MELLYYVAGFLFVLFILMGVRIVRPTERGIIERLGKYFGYAAPGFHWIIPFVDRMIKINVTERMIDSERQEIITKDKLNARVDAVVYFKIKSDETNLKNSQYNVDSVDDQIVSLARTTLRNIIGTMTLAEANGDRNKINNDLRGQLAAETKHWGIEIVRTELKEIEPPADVQEAMNKVVKAENEKIAARDLAEAEEIKADGVRRAKIKMAEGEAKSVEVEAVAKAQAIREVNTAVEKTFTAKAQLLRSLEAVEKSLSHNAKIVIPAGEKLVNVVGDLAGFVEK